MYQNPDRLPDVTSPSATPENPLSALLRNSVDLAALLAPGDAERVAESIPAFLRPQYDEAMRIRMMVEDDHTDADKRARFAREFARRDLEEELSLEYAEHKRAKMLESGAHQDLADAFKDLCLTSDMLDTMEIPDPLVRGFMDKSSLVRLFGPSNSLKSFVGLDLAGCVAAGIEWHGNVTTQGNTLYVAAEGAAGMIKRVRAWEKKNGRKFEGIIYPFAVQIADAKEMAKLVAYATIGKFEFVVFDTQARCTVGLDENSNTEMGTIVANLDALKVATGACVMMVHHSGSDNAERARGATAIYAAMDAEFRVTRKGMHITVETMKRKDGAQAEPLHLSALEMHVTTPRGEDTSLALVSGHTSDGYASSEVLSVPTITTAQTATLVALARYDSQGPTQLAVDQGMPKDRKNVVAQDLASLKRFDCVEKVGSHYRINDRGWKVLEALKLNTGWHTVAPLDEDDQ